MIERGAGNVALQEAIRAKSLGIVLRASPGHNQCVSIVFPGICIYTVVFHTKTVEIWIIWICGNQQTK